MLPGLIDSHVHFDLAAHPAPFSHWDRMPFVRSMTCLHNGLLALRAGITSVRDLGSVDHMVVDYSRQVSEGHLIGPQVIAAGRPITMTGGHCADYGRVADGAEELRLAVREQIAAGARVIKLMATGGISSPGNPGLAQLTVEEMSVAVEEAHKAGLSVAAHAHAPDGIANAIEAGVDTIEHAAFASDRSFEIMKTNGTMLVPTVSALNPIQAGVGIPAATVDKSLRAREIFRESTARAIAAGVRIAAGTDAGTAFNPIGGLLDEMQMYVDGGLTAADALRTATVNAGPLVRAPGTGSPEVGVIAIGSRADLLVANGDPRSDLEALRRPAHVIANGRLVDLDWVDKTIGELAGMLE
ncbi:amidohydrolase family protein [Arthrobacter sp. GAS37]|uniref:metal-dependent hydrolase family protein n=1 Tax=Arthrobacter sp. GAS37 TaxID=3156261 RepID=UPI00384D5BE5